MCIYIYMYTYMYNTISTILNTSLNNQNPGLRSTFFKHSPDETLVENSASLYSRRSFKQSYLWGM